MYINVKNIYFISLNNFFYDIINSYIVEDVNYMYILAKSILALMIGFIVSVLFGLFFVPLLRKIKAGQTASRYVKAHQSKSGTPTMGGIIFTVSTMVTIFALYITKKINISWNLLIILFVFFGYGIIGFIDDYKKIKYKSNEKGLTRIQKLIMQVVIAIVFFFLYIRNGSNPVIEIYALNISVNLGFMYGFFILFMLVGTSNAVNLTDGLDGLAGGLSFIAFLVYGMIAWNSNWMAGNDEVAIFCFILSGSLLGFLVYNAHPAKVFMGDTGSLALGGTLATVAILTHRELSLAVIGGVFVIETLSVILQIASVKLRGKKLFLMTPIHHTFEKLGWAEVDIVRLFYIVGFIILSENSAASPYNMQYIILPRIRSETISRLALLISKIIKVNRIKSRKVLRLLKILKTYVIRRFGQPHT